MTMQARMRGELASLKNWGELPPHAADARMAEASVVDCGWGRLIFGQTFGGAGDVAATLADEAPGLRDVAMYVREPQVILAAAPQELFLDPSQTYRLDLAGFGHEPDPDDGLLIRPAGPEDEDAVNRLYLARGMVPVTEGFCQRMHNDPSVIMLVAEDEAQDGTVVGVVMGVDHALAFNDPDNGTSLWALAVDPQASRPGIGRAMVISLANWFKSADRDFMDLSVMHDNAEAIALYRKLGFRQVPVYCIKRKNPINEKLFIGEAPSGELNVYARIIVDEARRRGINVEIEDTQAGLFRLSLGGRSVSCRESLSDATSAVALSRCDDKALTRRILQRAGLRTPDQITIESDARALEFLKQHGQVVVKPAQGEQGQGVSVGLSSPEDVELALERARQTSDRVLMEAYVNGRDLRIIVIDGKVVAAALRLPPTVSGDGRHTIEQLIEKQSRRRAAATDGESRIPLDEETRRCIRDAGYEPGDVLPADRMLTVRRTANLHAGGTIHDVTADLNPMLEQAAVEAARALEIPVVGLDFMVPDPAGEDYVIIEANERPGLANHEPQPTVERFIDFLFPMTIGNRNV